MVKVAAGVFGGVAMTALVPFVLAGLAFLGVAGVLIWLFLRVH